ncbi:MAG: hypothetical protein AB7T63_10520 [Planctomycetota bacterium]
MQGAFRSVRLAIGVALLSGAMSACGGEKEETEEGSRAFLIPIQKVTLVNNSSKPGKLDVIGSAKGVANTKTLWVDAAPGQTATSDLGYGEYMDSAEVRVTFTQDGRVTWFTGSGSWPNTVPPTCILEVTATVTDNGGTALLKILGREETITLSNPVASTPTATTAAPPPPPTPPRKRAAGG